MEQIYEWDPDNIYITTSPPISRGPYNNTIQDRLEPLQGVKK
jgi:ABC-type Fe3+-hydroxamate transport system substrate-binding protein